MEGGRSLTKGVRNLLSLLLPVTGAHPPCLFRPAAAAASLLVLYVQEVIITGTMHGKTAVAAGDTVVCDFGALGELTVQFVE